MSCYNILGIIKDTCYARFFHNLYSNFSNLITISGIVFNIFIYLSMVEMFLHSFFLFILKRKT